MPSKSLPVRGAWIEIVSVPWIDVASMSLPVRGAWIEISASAAMPAKISVAPRKGSVD